MNPIQKAIDEIKYSIPMEVLKMVFVQRSHRWRAAPSSIDEQIMALVVRPRVCVDCDLIGGTEVYIPLAGLMVDRTDEMTSIYHIPKAMTQNRSITSVLNITFTDMTRLANQIGGVTGISGMQQSQFLQAGSAVMDSFGALPIASTARIQLIGENVVMVKDATLLPPNVFLRCVLANAENFEHLQLRSVRPFCLAVEYAVKAYIYNERIVAMDQAELSGGSALGRIKEIIDGYADANELYRTHLREVLEKVLLMNDQESWTRMLKSIVSGNR